ncbi:hypothetical protein SAMN05660816_04178 [Niastella yeongjuensis]|nr:hypothetical protein SAMN05660816_04178 [Niastella yeongjuensis]
MLKPRLPGQPYSDLTATLQRYALSVPSLFILCCSSVGLRLPKVARVERGGIVWEDNDVCEVGEL